MKREQMNTRAATADDNDVGQFMVCPITSQHETNF
jgi:hypothetical protein